MELGGLHHVTAITGNASGNVRFYTQVLGMRLVKKTVNQDDVSAYHLFYADEDGNPGTDVTFFDWPRIPGNLHGTGMIGAIALRVPSRTALEWWAERLKATGNTSGRIEDRGGRETLRFTDPEGQRLQLIVDGGRPGGKPWDRSTVPVEMAIRGIHSVALTVRSLAPTEQLLTQVMEFRRLGSYPNPESPDQEVVVFETGQGGPGAEVHLEVRPQMPAGHLGVGGVHHVAFRTPDAEEQIQWRERLSDASLGVTPVIDRYYFKSVYFREPQGVLFEIATDGPGFATDEPKEHLGERLSLPPFLEARRAQIEAGLKPISMPAETRKAA